MTYLLNFTFISKDKEDELAKSTVVLVNIYINIVKLNLKLMLPGWALVEYLKIQNIQKEEHSKTNL